MEKVNKFLTSIIATTSYISACTKICYGIKFCKFKRAKNPEGSGKWEGMIET
jgi:hypothetical protein